MTLPIASSFGLLPGHLVRAALSLALVTGVAGTVFAQDPQTPTVVTVQGGAAAATQRLPAGQAQFGIRVPLKRNAENILTVTATNDLGQSASQQVSVTQLTLEEIVRAQVTAQRLTTPEIKALVADGTIDLKDPDNFAVSVFDIVLTIGGRPAQVRMPVVRPKEQPFGIGEPVTIGCSASGKGIQTTERAIAIPCGGGGGGSKVPDIEVIPFEIEMPGAEIEARVPGVILIEGRIKTLKDFYRVTLLLMNVSGLFTLDQIVARLEVPEGALAHIAPASGTVAIDPIPAGGQGSGEFIVRGDQIGIHTVTAHFGANLLAPFLPEAVPITGSASTDVEVKAPPRMDVTVEHPNFVVQGEPYWLTVHIENTDPERDALYTTFELDVGLDAELIDETTGLPLEGPAVRTLGDILVGQKVTQKFRVLPKKTGPIASCTAGAHENLKLNVVFTGTGGGPGCAIGTLPSSMRPSDGKPTVSVIPTHNTTGVTVDPAITAIFSAPMITYTITTGSPASTFRLIDPEGNVVRGELQFGEIFGGTVAVFRPSQPLLYDAEYTVIVEPTIYDENGLQLSSGMIARFTTEPATAAPDVEPPEGILVVEPPVNPDAVIKGQFVPVTVDSFDNVGVIRVDVLLDGKIVDTKKPNSPVHFLLDTAKLAQGSEHQLSAHLFDAAGNAAILTTTLRVAPDSTPPTVNVSGPPSIARGRPLSLSVGAADDGRIEKVQAFVDGGNDPVQSLMVAPFIFTIPTGALATGPHVVRVVATDGDGNSAHVDHFFEVLADTVPPTIVISSPEPGAEVRAGTPLAVLVTAVDDIGIAGVEVFLDDESTPRSTDISGFSLPTTGLALGPHVLRAVARDVAGNVTSVEAPFVLFEPPVDTTPPAAPLAAAIQLGVPAGGVSAITGLPGAVEAGARVEMQNTASLAGAQATALPTGAFTAHIEGSGGQTVSFVAIDAAGNRSAPTVLEIPAPATLTSLAVAPPSVTLNRANAAQQLTVTGTFSDGSTRALSSGEVTFVSLERTIADVNATGLVLPGANGNTTVRVSAPGVDAVDVPVTTAMPTIASVSVSPDPVSLFGIGSTVRLSVMATYSDGVKQPFTGQVGFASNDPGVATVDSQGQITGAAAGAAIVTVAPAGFPVVHVNVAVNVTTLTSLSVTPTGVTLIGIGQTQALSVVGHYSDGSSQPLTSGVTFLSANPAVATVAAGIVTAAGNGNTTIEVSANGVPAVHVAVIVKSLTAIALTPPSLTIVGVNQTRQLNVVRTFSDGSSATDRTGVVFTTSDPAVAVVDESGLVRSVGVGDATITAELAGVAPATSSVTVEDISPMAVVATPASLAFSAIGETGQLTAQYRMTDGSLADIADPITFSVRDVAVAHVSDSGVVTALQTGVTLIDVSAGGLTTAVVVSVDLDVEGTPEITELGRRIAGEGDTVLIHGRNFHGFADRNVVTFNGTAAEVIGASEDRLIALVPRGATSGPVQVTVDGVASNVVDIEIYPRRARSLQVTTPFNTTPAAPGTRTTLASMTIDYRPGDQVMLTGYPDTIVGPVFSSLPGPEFTGRLLMTLNGQDAIVSASAAPVDLAALLPFQPGDNALAFVMEEFGGNLASQDLAVVSGPPGTGPFAGERFLTPDTLDQRLVIRFRNLPIPDGGKVAVTAASWYRVSDGGCCNNSAGGEIVDGSPTSDSRFRAFTVTGGEVAVTYSDVGIAANPDQRVTAVISVLPANDNGSRTQTQPIAEARVLLGGVDSASVIPVQTSSVADGTERPIPIELNSFRDDYGNPLPDGVLIGLTATNWNRVSDGGCCNNSVGGAFIDGVATPDGRIRRYVIEHGRVTATYSPTGVELSVGDVRRAIVSALVLRENGNRLDNRPFAAGHVTLSSASGGEIRMMAVPTTLAATMQDNRAVVTAFNITDASGLPVPDGTKLAITAADWNRVSDGGCCNGAIGGKIVGGNPTNDGRLRWFPVQGGQLVFEYSAEGVGLGKDVTANAIVSVLPADGSGNRIGATPLAALTIPLGGASSATVTPDVASSIADGTDRPIRVVVENLRDAFNNPVPDGTRIGLTANNWNRLSDGGCCNNSVGGRFTDGDETPDGRIRAYTVVNGRVEATYSPIGVALEAGVVRQAILSALVLDATDNRIGNRPFATGVVTLSSAQGANATVVVQPETLLADTQEHVSLVTITDLRDSQGRPIPDGTRFAVTASSWNLPVSGSCCNGSIGGGFLGGAPTNDGRLQAFVLTNGTLQFAYTDAGVGLGTRETAPAHISVLPADGNGNRIGNTPVLATTVMLGGIGTAAASAPATVLPGSSTTVTFSDIRDQFGNLVPDGTRVVVTAEGWYRVGDGGCCNGSAGGTIADGESTPDGRFRMFTVANGEIHATFVAPNADNVTSVISVVPSRVDGNRIGDRPFAAVSIRVTTTP